MAGTVRPLADWAQLLGHCTRAALVGYYRKRRRLPSLHAPGEVASAPAQPDKCRSRPVRAAPGAADHDEIAVARQLVKPGTQLTEGNVDRLGSPADTPLFGLTYVDEHGVTLLQEAGGLDSAELWGGTGLVHVARTIAGSKPRSCGQNPSISSGIMVF